MRGGTYRTGGLKLNQGITIQPYADEKPVLKGTNIADKWERLEKGLWKTSWPTLFPSKPADWWQQDRNKGTPLHRFNNDMVFIDGKFLQSAGKQADVNANSYFIDYNDKTVFIGTEPARKLVEITAFDSAIMRTKGNCTGNHRIKKGRRFAESFLPSTPTAQLKLKGKSRKACHRESKFGKEVVGSTFENCTISFCSRVAAYLRGDKLTIKNCLVSDTSTEGIYVIGSADVLLEKNIFRRNNIENITGYFPAGVKIFNQCHRVICRDNYVTDQPNSNGIWYDVGNVDGVFINNLVEGVGKLRRKFNKERFFPSDQGFFFEISKGAICAGNVFVNCDHGIFILNSCNVQIYNNTFVNSTACISRTERSAVGDHFGWHPSTGPDVNEREGHVFVNNLLTEEEGCNRPLLAFLQAPMLCKQLNKPQVKQLDYNVFVRRGEKPFGELILWSPVQNEKCQAAFESPEAMHKKNPEFLTNSRNFVNYGGPLFRDAKKGELPSAAGV